MRKQPPVPGGNLLPHPREDERSALAGALLPPSRSYYYAWKRSFNMTKRKRTPPPSPPPGAQVPFQIPASLQRLSVISRSLAHQSDKLVRFGADGQNARFAAQAQGQAGVPPPVMGAASPGTAVRHGRGQGFRAFAPRKQPSFPDAQTWVEPRARGTQVPDAAGFVPPTQPSFPKGQAWPQPQPQKGQV